MSCIGANWKALPMRQMTQSSSKVLMMNIVLKHSYHFARGWERRRTWSQWKLSYWIADWTTATPPQTPIHWRFHTQLMYSTHSTMIDLIYSTQIQLYRFDLAPFIVYCSSFYTPNEVRHVGVASGESTNMCKYTTRFQGVSHKNITFVVISSL